MGWNHQLVILYPSICIHIYIYIYIDKYSVFWSSFFAVTCWVFNSFTLIFTTNKHFLKPHFADTKRALFCIGVHAEGAAGGFAGASNGTVDRRNPVNSPVEVGSWNPIIYKVLYIPGGAPDFWTINSIAASNNLFVLNTFGFDGGYCCGCCDVLQDNAESKCSRFYEGLL